MVKAKTYKKYYKSEEKYEKDCVIAAPYNDQTKGQTGTWDLTILLAQII